MRQRLKFNPPQTQGRRTIWLHAVSVGEVKAASELLCKIKADDPAIFVLVTTVTATGFAEAERSLPQADAIRFMPLDFSFLIRKWVRAIRPQLFLCIEGDAWPNLLRAVRTFGGKSVLVSGKLSERSFRRFSTFRHLGKALFSLFDLVLVQTAEHERRFAPFVSPDKLRIGGNLKWDARRPSVDLSRYASLFDGVVIAIASTHAPEEAELLDALKPLDATLLFAPRHPHRFEEVAGLLQARNIPYCLWSQIGQRLEERVILVDAMGQLPIIFSLSHLAIVAGSFSSRIGGHNVLEPCLYGIPVFFGPHMHTQTELAERVLAANAGRQAESSQLAASIATHLANPAPLRQGVSALFEGAGGALDTTWKSIREL